jgi:hypothetical protein
VPAFRIEGYVIVSADGMLANTDRVMPAELKFEGDKQFFTDALDRADLIVHGRHSFEDQPNSPLRKRIVLTRTIDAIAPDPRNPKAVLWNPVGATFEAARDFAGVHSGTIAIIGGPGVFGMFIDRYDTFWLSQAAHVRLPGGEPCFPGVPQHSPQEILAAHGLRAGDTQILDAANDVSVTPYGVITPLNIAIDRLRRPRRPAIACDHQQGADDRQILQRMDHVVPAFRAGLGPEVVIIIGRGKDEED